jgi:DNA-binding IclR family transcriptional regulator
VWIACATLLEAVRDAHQNAAKSYLPSPRLARFGAWMVTNYGANERLQTLLAEVQRASGATVTITTPNDIFMQIVDLAGGKDSSETAGRGLRVSVFGSTIGTAYLSTLTMADIAKLANRATVRSGDLTRLLESIERVRLNGVGDGPSPDGEIWSIVAPLPKRNALAPIVLGVAGSTPRVQPNIAFLRELIRGARA